MQNRMRRVIFVLLANHVAWTSAYGWDGNVKEPTNDLFQSESALGVLLSDCPSPLAKPSVGGPRLQPGSAEEDIVTLLRKMPDWVAFSHNRDYRAEEAEIERSVAAIASHDLDTVRAALEYYSTKGWSMNNCSSIGALAKMMIVNKFLFKLPRVVRRDSPHFRSFGGGWWGLPISGESGDPRDSDEMTIRWPWSEDEQGKWHLTGRFAGFTGEQYHPLVAFDYYRAAFGRRDAAQGDTVAEKFYACRVGRIRWAFRERKRGRNYSPLTASGGRRTDCVGAAGKSARRPIIVAPSSPAGLGGVRILSNRPARQHSGPAERLNRTSF